MHTSRLAAWPERRAGVDRASAGLLCLELLRQYILIGAEPVGFLDELAALGLEDLHPAAAFVVAGAEFERRNEAAQGEAVDCFKSLFHVFAGRLLAASRLDGIADCLDMQRSDEQTAIVVHGALHLLRRPLALCLVHSDDLLARRIVVPDPGELDRVIALG